MSQPSQNTTISTNKLVRVLGIQTELYFIEVMHAKGGSRILAMGVHMSDGKAQEAQSLYVYRQCIIHAFIKEG